MKKQLLAVGLLALSSFTAMAQQTIQSARAAALGTVVTVKGIALNGTELGAARYIMDGTGAIIGYSATQFASINRGDSVKITGTTKTYKCLLELDPVTAVVKVNIGNTLPTAISINPNATNETYEAQLVKFTNVKFKKVGNFVGNTNYTIVGASPNDTALVRITNGTNLVGTPIPTGSVNLTGIVSQFSQLATCTDGYQVLLRDANDVVQNASIFLTADMTQNTINTASINLAWATNVAGTTSYIKWGTATNALTNTINANNATTHTAAINGLQAGMLYYVKAFSINGIDTAKTQTKVFVTESNSTGKITCYFNRTVDNTVAMANNNAIQLPSLVADTLAQYINRAQSTIDLAIYNWGTGSGSAIATALNNAKTRGVKIRCIFDGSTAQTASQLLNVGGSLQVATSPQGINYTIMHNKFVVIDAEATNANLPIVWTGSTNWTTAQLNSDANSVIIVQDQVLARNYTVEFNEMWGDNVAGGATNVANSKYGQYKTDNTAHEFKIGGNRIENYFSPSDGTNSKLVNTVNTGSSELYTANLSFTKTDVAYAIRNMKLNNPSAVMYSLFDDTSGSLGAWPIVKQALGANATQDKFTWILHHKYAIVDQNDAASDPLLWVGSHNWSTAADTKNDENTLVVHNQKVANQYYQEFIQRLKDNNIVPILTNLGKTKGALLAVAYPNPANDVVTISLLKNELATLNIYSTTGALMYTTTTNSGCTINVNNWTKGMYIVQIAQDKTIATSKLIVE
jgi:phosphatidylserine/phosphatidylglycerophosphate/cardiolipin synthase-like enzyme